MRLTKFGHACVRLEKDGRAIVIDPGAFSDEPGILDGADAILLTHEHFDHFVPERVRQALADDPRLEVWASRAVAAQIADAGKRVHEVGHGDAVTVAGFDVHVYGRDHEILHPDVPPIPNTGFLVDGEVFHPGDALTVPDEPVPTLCLPANAPWMKVPEMYEYVRAIRPARAFAIHDGLLNENGLPVVTMHVGKAGEDVGGDFRRLAPGESVDLP
ncbi:MBL fold metallo-hydrolase [Actinomadura rayongensis]|uniref:MBL fold metallo-hydrolase n=1 Tax=Actinomadura rayongensis TaxID=1429076 RepID=A0A6I4WM20_9ACTN|nr:MBL fold metallo-hydrolase [Actinomadura rayongensis]MXQ68004.1 MBL fold metallo-hydrolase [Actinomadura rayongensis]